MPDLLIRPTGLDVALISRALTHEQWHTFLKGLTQGLIVTFAQDHRRVDGPHEEAH